MPTQTRASGRRLLPVGGASRSAAGASGSGGSGRSHAHSRAAATRTSGQVSSVISDGSSRLLPAEVRVASTASDQARPSVVLPATLGGHGGGGIAERYFIRGKEVASVVKLGRLQMDGGDVGLSDVDDGVGDLWTRYIVKNGKEMHSEQVCLSPVGNSGRVHVGFGCTVRNHNRMFFQDLDGDIQDQISHEKVIYLCPCRGGDFAFRLPILLGSQVLDEDQDRLNQSVKMSSEE
ncbi:hypothetical protein THAOC_13340 [Thalassiosira oceanica]|uniref:Uncharacterized protein n=1 Tax=Thalassiosira oceanica TaxID=159749 RepID=K0SKD5_THAOC|nr:hypothetical protein THAOC_13340 [Thalassiosira oceanica]|eukprot:EJK65770.1 hypothetical protein THAOC_13340 [Thalassiosira oceanica]